MIFSFLMLLLSSRLEAQLTLVPEALTVLQGDEAQLTCSTRISQWTVMVWLLNNEVVLTITNSTGVQPSVNSNVAAKQLSPNSWTFILKNTTRLNHGQVTCDLQGIGRKSAELHVQEKGHVKILGEDRLAFKGQPAVFECQAAGWYPKPALWWQVNKAKQDVFNVSAGAEANGVFSVTSSLLLTADTTSRVDCLAFVSALAQPLRASVGLTVVTEVQQESNCSVALVVVASLFALLLLLLICTTAVLCYRRRRQARMSKEVPFRFSQSGRGTDSVASATEGNVNPGFSGEGATDTKPIIMRSGGRKDFSTLPKVPDLLSSSSQSLHTQNQDQNQKQDQDQSEESSQSLRRITTV